MLWQDLVFTIGSGLSIAFLAPTLRDATANVPLGTSLPSMAIGFVYGVTFFTLGMAFSAVGSIAAGTMWALIALVRSPRSPVGQILRVESPELFATDLRRWVDRRRSSALPVEQFVVVDRAGRPAPSSVQN